ncbi:hypothetical protein QE408_000716 [Agrobacterium larrymoorei]|uniref:Uncharacterized protein n=1 Tax=Agrobacterium larrymoorei TaxID=160699 RepID=A0ABU0UF76_9HYPH|nr:hypothetical protein [Agrobacterium larrymoorei]
MFKLIKAIFLGVGTILLCGFSLLIVLSGIGIYSEGGSYETFMKCQMRRIEAKVSDDIANVHTDYCMYSEGYRRAKCESDLPYLPSCYVSKWFAWI